MNSEPTKACWIIRADGGHDLGLGHINRCIVIADELARRGVTSVFVARDSGQDVPNLVRASGHRIEFLSSDISMENEVAALDDIGLDDVDGILLDLSHAETFANEHAVPGFFRGLRRRFPNVAIIDNLYTFCLAERFELPVDLVTIPYVEAESCRLRTSSAQLCLGPSFFVLDHAYGPGLGTDREIAIEAKRILVTSGGSDPMGLCHKSIQAMDFVADRDLMINVVIGPAFAAGVINDIQHAARNCRHHVTFVEQPKNLVGEMESCDIALSASGLTKYELAATGTPAIIIPIDDTAEAFNRSFQSLRTANHLCALDQLEPRRLAGAVATLLDDHVARLSMSRAGKALLDGKGTARLVDCLISLADESRPRYQVPHNTKQQVHP